MFGKKEKIHILLIDRSDQVRDIAKSVLEGSGYSVSSVSNIQDAYKELAKKRIHVIITEVELPGGGFSFYGRLKKNKETRRIPFIFFGHDDNKKLLSTIHKYKDTLISKTSSWKEFVTLVHSFLSKRLAPKKQKSVVKSSSPQKAGTKQQTSNSAKHTQPKMHHKKTPPAKSTHIDSEKQKTSPKGMKTNTVPDKASLSPKEIDIRHSPVTSVKRKKHSMMQTNVVPGNTTFHFPTPSSVFDLKSLGLFTSSLFRSFKKGNPYEETVLEFTPIEIPTQGLREELRKEITSKTFQGKEDFLAELEIEEVEVEDIEQFGDAKYLLQGDDILYELDDDVEESSEETPLTISMDENEAVDHSFSDEKNISDLPLPMDQGSDVVEIPSFFHQHFPEYSLTQELATLHLDSENFTNNTNYPIEKDQFEDINHAVLSMAGLCLQMFNLDFHADAMVVSTKDKDIFIVQNEDQTGYDVGITSQAIF